jgi:trans-2,3-dihydro-3-hydroxyanthranilate isomerase
MLSLRYVICDVFTEQPLAGNPLCVFTDARRLDAERMLALAREMNLSETVFVLPAERGGHARLRIFTPRQELPFAGHPTLGAAFVLGGPLEVGILRLEVPAGIVPVQLTREGARVTFGWFTPPAPRPVEAPELSRVVLALGAPPLAFGAGAYESGARHISVPLASADAVRGLQPDLGALAAATDAIVSAFHFDGERCKSRVFAPRAGVSEDPATGSAAAPLALHLLRHGRLSRSSFVIEQGTELSRPSQLHVQIAQPAGDTPEISVGGSAVIVARGQFTLPEASAPLEKANQ